MKQNHYKFHLDQSLAKDSFIDCIDGVDNQSSPPVFLLYKQFYHLSFGDSITRRILLSPRSAQTVFGPFFLLWDSSRARICSAYLPMTFPSLNPVRNISRGRAIKVMYCYAGRHMPISVLRSVVSRAILLGLDPSPWPPAPTWQHNQTQPRPVENKNTPTLSIWPASIYSFLGCISGIYIQQNSTSLLSFYPLSSSAGTSHGYKKLFTTHCQSIFYQG